MLSKHLALTPEVSYNMVSFKLDDVEEGYEGSMELDGSILMVSIGLAGFIK